MKWGYHCGSPKHKNYNKKLLEKSHANKFIKFDRMKKFHEIHKLYKTKERKRERKQFHRNWICSFAVSNKELSQEQIVTSKFVIQFKENISILNKPVSKSRLGQISNYFQEDDIILTWKLDNITRK